MKATRGFLLSSVFTASTIALTITGMGCSGISGTSSSGGGTKTLSSVAVSPASMSIQSGQTQQFTATAKYSDGTSANVSSTATWTVSSGSIASVNNAGLVTAKAAGSATVKASLDGMNGSAALTVQSPTKTLTSVSVTPASASIAAGATEQFTATATYSDGTTSDVTSNGATWSSSASSVATISTSGLATAVSVGQATLTATYQGKSGSAALTATAATVTSVAVSPTSASLQVGGTQQFTATATYSDGTTGNVTSSAATWSSSASSIATIGASGLATAVSAGQATLSAAYQGKSGSATLTAIAVTSLAVTPTSVNLVVGGTQQFTATATYANGKTGNVTSLAAWSSGNTNVVTVSSTGFAIAVGTGPATSVTASFGGFDSSATVNVSQSSGSGANIPMFHVDQNRSGANLKETILRPANITSQSFGKLFSQLVDGYVYGQPLLVSNLTMGDGTTHNVMFAATENDSVYAFDADSNTGSNANPLWQVSLLQPGETPITNGPIKPVEGVTSTPAIDLTTNTMYVVSMQASAAGGTFRLNALDITSGAQRTGSPVQITAQVQGTNSTTLTTACLQRSALLVAYGSVYIGFGSCHSGWLLSYDKTSLVQTGVFNSSPNLTGEGPYASAGGVWMGGGGPAADGHGNVYISTGNGPWDGQTAYSDSILKFSQTLQLEDYFTPYVYAYMDCADADLAAGGLLLIPASGATPMQALAGGKTGKLYLVNTEDLGQEQNNDIGATYTTFFEPDLSPPYENTCTSSGSESGSAEINSYEIFGTATYFNGSVYLGITPTGAVPAPIRQFVYSPGSSTPLAYNSNYTPNDYIQGGSYGTTTFISANGTSNGVLWMIDHGDPLQGSGTQTNATLRVYDPNSLSNGELYDSSMAANGADIPGYGIKFTAPIAANGKVYISTGHDLVSTPNPQGELDVYGLK